MRKRPAERTVLLQIQNLRTGVQTPYFSPDPSSAWWRVFLQNE